MYLLVGIVSGHCSTEILASSRSVACVVDPSSRRVPGTRTATPQGRNGEVGAGRESQVHLKRVLTSKEIGDSGLTATFGATKG